MFSKISLNYIKKKDLKKINNFYKKKNLNGYLELIKTGLIPRPQYALGFYLSSSQAIQIGLKEISIIEVGCYDESSIQDLIEHKNIIEEIMPIKINLLYFDIPIKTVNFFKSIYDRRNFFKKIFLKKKNFTFKNIKILQFKKINEISFLKSPLGYLIFDTRNFSITNKVFQIFRKNAKNFLPRSFLYFDHFFQSSEYEGEFYSIKVFNKKNKYKKISDILELPEQLSLTWLKWIFLSKRLKYLVNFKHKNFNSKINLVI